MKPAYIKISIVLVLITGLVTAVAIYFHQDNKKFSMVADCGMENGPLYGRKTSVDIRTVVVDESVNIPGGKLFICNTPCEDLELDSLAPVLFKLDSIDHVVWAVELKSDNEINLFAMEDCRLIGHELHFFNSTHLEPGVIYLDENFNFKYMCLNMF